MRQIPVLTIRGSHFQMGLAHGIRFKDEIQRYTEERIRLVGLGTWSGGKRLARHQILSLAEACIPAHEAYAPDLTAELQGMAEGADLSLAEMIIVNGFTDFLDTVYNAHTEQPHLEPVLTIDDCTAFIVPDHLAGGCGFLGQTWDMHDTALEYVLMLDIKPDNSPSALIFTTSGCIGQIGMNEHGIAVGINNLSGADGKIGVTWPFVVRKILQQDNIEDALDCILEADLAGAHNYLLFDALGNGCNVEAMSSNCVVERLDGKPLSHTNHCLVPENLVHSQEKLATSQEHSEQRLDLARQLLETAETEITIEMLQALTRKAPICTVPDPLFHAMTCGAAIMRPKTGEMWAVQGLPSENEYELFDV